MQAGAHTFTILPQYNMAALNLPDSGDYAGSFMIGLMPGDSHATVGYVRFYAMTPEAEKMGDQRRWPAPGNSWSTSAARLVDEYTGCQALGSRKWPRLCPAAAI